MPAALQEVCCLQHYVPGSLATRATTTRSTVFSWSTHAYAEKSGQPQAASVPRHAFSAALQLQGVQAATDKADKLATRPTASAPEKEAQQQTNSPSQR
jgi:hypothetical protein